jgi:hypothetical protein
MRRAIPPFLQYAFKAWCSVEAQGQLYLHEGKYITTPYCFSLIIEKVILGTF